MRGKIVLQFFSLLTRKKCKGKKWFFFFFTISPKKIEITERFILSFFYGVVLLFGYYMVLVDGVLRL